MLTEKLGLPKEVLANHKDIHGKLIEDVFRLNEGVASGKIMSMYEIEKFLTEWLVLHILIEDKKYHDYLAG